MGQRIFTETFDDIDQSVGEDVTTSSFGLGGTTYEIDLGPKNRARLHEVLEEFVANARVVRGERRPYTKRNAPVTTTRVQRSRGYPKTTKDGENVEKAARRWAQETGLEPLGNRGRLAASTAWAYVRAHPDLFDSADLDVEHDGADASVA